MTLEGEQDWSLWGFIESRLNGPPPLISSGAIQRPLISGAFDAGKPKLSSPSDQPPPVVLPTSCPLHAFSDIAHYSPKLPAWMRVQLPTRPFIEKFGWGHFWGYI